MQLTFDSDVEEFRAEFAAFLDEHLPPEAETLERPRSVSHMPQWARKWQRLLFDNGWLLPAQPPEFGGRNATVLQQFVHLDELCRRRIYHSLNPQGVNIIAASLISFGSEEQKHRWAVPVLKAELTASLGMSEPSAGSDLASLRTRAVRDAWRPLRRQRPEGVDLRRPRRRLPAGVRAHRPGRAEAQGHQRADHSHRHPGCGVPAVRRHLRPGELGLQRGLLHRRARCPPRTSSGRSTVAGAWPMVHSDTSAR